LRAAVPEANAVKRLLSERYYIDDFFELYDADATAANIRKLFVQTLPAKVGIKDSVLVFYAGHGQLDSSGTGFWIAADGTKDALDQSGWIPNAQLRNLIGNLKAQRILVLADACFSGDFLNVNRGASPTVDSAYFRRALQLTARQVLTSGASESVPDESEFGRQLLNLLERNTEAYLDPIGMYERIRLGVSKTQPLLGTLPGNETGASYVLFLKPSGAAPASAAGSAPQSPAKAPRLSVTPAAKTYGAVTITVKTTGTLFLDGAELGAISAGVSARLDDVESGSRSVEIRYADGKRESASVMVPPNGSGSANFGYAPAPVVSITASVPVERAPGSAIRGEIFVKGGMFKMGSDSGDPNEKPVHEVHLSDFWMMKTEVTQKDYVAFLGTNPSKFNGDDLPVEQVSWYDAVAYANKLSASDGLRPAYTINGTDVSCDWRASGWRLPTETEWEYAARGGQNSRGYKYSGSDDINSVAWYTKTTNNVGTKAVGTKVANELGLCDMSGNVWEWCWDWKANYSTGSQTDSCGASSGTYRVYRGGGWGFGTSIARSAIRSGDTPDNRDDALGFRLVRRP
ncbi:MAG: SUMF1/EgtB/PvdO family nonheme iron enzyme, partial [Treponemataceae bacterium]